MRRLHRSSTFMKNHLSWPQPVTYFIVLTLIVLLLPAILIPYWYQTVKKIKHNMEMEATYGIASKVDNTAKLVLPVNSSARVLASVLGSVHQHLPFSEVRNKVAPVLFEALMMIPQSTQASYIGLDGLIFSYYKDNNDKIYAAYSNSTFGLSNSSAGNYTWYTQLANSESGELDGEANNMEPVSIINEIWFQGAMNSSNDFGSLGFSWFSKKGDEPDLFLDTSRLGSVGVISVGFAVKGIANLFSDIDLNGGSLYMATVTDDIRVLSRGMEGVRIKSTGDKAMVVDVNTDHVIGEFSCKTQNGVGAGASVSTMLKIGQTDQIFYCSHIDIARVDLVYVFAFPSHGDFLGIFHRRVKVTMILVIVMMVAMVISIFVFVALIVRAAWREVQLCAAYMRQMEKTTQAERKSLKQSLAFASANHDVRGYLACIKGLLDLCHNDVHPSSELASNFKKIDTCADDLLAMVNSILDFSKIEAGKMQLEEKGFNLEQLIEDITDLHYPVALKKGVDLILDPCDGSIVNFSSVIGDRGKLKQILSNLLSNAVKYTPRGHILIRAWAKKPSMENSIIASNKNSLLSRLSHIFYRNKRSYNNNLDVMRMSNEDSKRMEFVFEVEDTGLGIPIDKRKSIFEDYVQVKENSFGQVGTGLGLGIVQALVRLMGGDIEIVDKFNGEQGTCFRFNIFLTVEETAPINSPLQNRVHNQDNYPSSELSSCVHSPRLEGSIVALLMNNDERRSMVQRYMENVGIKVVVVRQVNQIPRALKNKIKFKLTNASRCYTSSSGSLPLSSYDGATDRTPVCSRPTVPGTVRCVMLILDANAGDFQEMCRSVALLRKDNLEACIKVVWLERPETKRAHFSGLSDESLPISDCIIQEPLHGYRLFRVIELLPEFGGELIKGSRRKMNSGIIFPYNLSIESEELYYSSNSERSISRARSMIYPRNDDTRREVFLDYKSMSCSRARATTMINHTDIEEGSIKSSRRWNCSMSKDKSSSPPASETQTTGIELVGPSLNRKPLDGKRFLVVEDHPVGRAVATMVIKQLGGHAEGSENGKEALELICKALNALNGDVPSTFPYDYVLMDCKMDVMDGFEATRRIRQEERKHGIHIPIFALTANEPGETGNEITEAGMDLHLTKPLKANELLEAIRLF